MGRCEAFAVILLGRSSCMGNFACRKMREERKVRACGHR